MGSGVFEGAPVLAFARRGALCVECGEGLEEHEPCVWIEGKGVFHEKCTSETPEPFEPTKPVS